MNKNIQLLLEGLFDDFDDIFTLDDTAIDIAKSVSTPTSLFECSNKEELNEYLIAKYNLEERFNKFLNDFYHSKNHASTAIKNCDKNDYYIDDNYIGSTKFLSFVTKDNITINIELNTRTEENNSLIYRNKPLSGLNMVYLKVDKFTMDLGYDEHIISSLHQKAQDIIKDFNTNLFKENLAQKAKVFLRQVIEFKLGTEFLINEMKYPGKVYKVVQKDIDRMRKCLETGNYAGFDAITKPDKMVARLAAFFICAKDNYRYQDMELKLTESDYLLFTFHRFNILWRAKKINSRSNYYNNKYSSNALLLLEKLNGFPNIHLNDVLVTYNEYKDKF